MTREFLEGFGLEKEQINQILDQASKDIGQAIDNKEQESALNKKENEDLQEKLKAANDTIKNLQSNNSDNQKLQKQVTEYEEKIASMSAAHDKETISLLSDMELIQSGAINPVTVKPLIDFEKVELKDGKLIGLSEQLEAIKSDEKNTFLFCAPKTETPSQEKDSDQSLTFDSSKFFGGYTPNAGTGEVETESIGAYQAKRAQAKIVKESENNADFWQNCISKPIG